VRSSTIEGNARQVNESVYELHKPPSNPSVQIVFFHGLYMGDSPNAHVSTWESEDGSCIWPATWLVEPEEFPTAHVLSISYCGCVGKSSQGSLDMHNIGENLISDLMHANIGQSPHCPVVLVGYCFGGLVIKELCCQMNLRKNLTEHEKEKIKLETFLENLRGIFNYGTPHTGCSFVDKAKFPVESPMLEYFSYLNQGRSRLNHDFNQLYRSSKWLIDGVGESLPAKSV
jgi:hypothetical protein